MPASPDSEILLDLQEEIEAFLRALLHPVASENGTELCDLTKFEWALRIEYGKLVFEAWNRERSLVRRVERVAHRDPSRLSLMARKPGGLEPIALEFHERGQIHTARTGGDRAHFRQEILAMLAREFPGWKFTRVSNRSDREHSFSAWYTRGVAEQGPRAWAFLGLDEAEAAAASDAVLAFGLIWLDWLRARDERLVVQGLKLFLPAGAIELIAHRAACLDRRLAEIEIFRWTPGETRAVPVDLRDYGNVETRLVPRRQGEELMRWHQAMLADLLGDLLQTVDVIPDASATALSLRIRGLEIARLEGTQETRISFGLEGDRQRLGNQNRQEFMSLARRVVELRSARNDHGNNDLYRLQAERWLESLLVRDITKLDPALTPTCVYQQVPAFSGMDRGVIDLLSITRAGRLAVIELKLHEEINLPMQGLDYWLRVKWLNDRGQFPKFGYFSDAQPSPLPPLLYLVSPAFRFHSTTARVIRYFDPAIKVIQVGLNDGWRSGPKVLFRHEVRSGS
jgi:hypothetical protein